MESEIIFHSDTEIAAAGAAAASLFERKINFDSIQFDFSQFDLCAIL